MSTVLDPLGTTAGASKRRTVDMKLEVVVIPVADVDRAIGFYAGLGWRMDADFSDDHGFRVVQFTPPGSPCSVIFGTKVSDAAPGSAQGLYLAVSDIEAARADLAARGAEVSETFHDAGGIFPHAGMEGRASGPDPARRSYASYVSFSDPDGNGWLLQEITTRLPGRVEADFASFTSATELAAALRRAAVAHGDHEKRTGGNHAETWPDWYADFMMREQAGKPLSQ